MTNLQFIAAMRKLRFKTSDAAAKELGVSLSTYFRYRRSSYPIPAPIVKLVEQLIAQRTVTHSADRHHQAAE